MSKVLKDLTIVTITYNNEDELLSTLKSYEECIDLGATSVVINGGNDLSDNPIYKKVNLIEEKDEGIFDAINKGVSHVKTKYFKLIHSGDTFSGDNDYLIGLVESMNNKNLDILLGNQIIPFSGMKRRHRSNFWFPFFLSFGTQPPHLPTIYKKSFVNDIEYDKSNKVIADYFYFKEVFDKKPKWDKYKKCLIEMGPGGNTTSGVKSFVMVSKEFIKNYGSVRGVLISIFRVPFKFIQMI